MYWLLTPAGTWVTELSDWGKEPRVKHPVTKKSVTRKQLRAERVDGEIVGWRGRVDGVELLVIND